MKKRKAYRPRPLMHNPLSIMCPIPASAVAELELRYLGAIDMIASGAHPGENEWRDLADMLNITDTLVLQGKLSRVEVEPSVQAANVAMREAAHRFSEGKGMRMSGPGLEALRDVAAIHKQCLEGFTQREIEIAIAETNRAILAKRRDSSAEFTSL